MSIRGAGKISVMDHTCDYSEYRQFLKNYYQSNKAKSSAFTYLYIQYKAEVISTTLLKIIIRITKKITGKTTFTTNSALKLNGIGMNYFLDLLLFKVDRC